MSDFIKVIVTPDKKWWQFWIRRQYELVRGKDFGINYGNITFYKAPPKGEVTIDYVNKVK